MIWGRKEKKNWIRIGDRFLDKREICSVHRRVKDITILLKDGMQFTDTFHTENDAKESFELIVRDLE